MADHYNLTPGWRLWLTLSGTDDIGVAYLNNEIVCLTTIRSPVAEVDLTNILVAGDNTLRVEGHNSEPPFWSLRHQLKVRDAAGQSVPQIPDGQIDRTGQGHTPHAGLQQAWDYVFTMA